MKGSKWIQDANPLRRWLLVTALLLSPALIACFDPTGPLSLGDERLLAAHQRTFHRWIAQSFERTLDAEYFQNQPEGRMAYLIHREAGDQFFGAQDYASAAAHQKMASHLADQRFGENSVEALERLSHWTETLYFLDEYKTATPLAERALRLSESLHGEESLQTAARQSVLALIYAYSDQDEAAVLLAGKALRTRIERQGLEHTDTIEQLRIYAEAGRNRALGPERGAKIDEIALALSTTFLGWNTVRTETLLNDIDWFYRQLGDCGKSLPYAEAALELTLKLEGDQTSEAANRFHSLGTDHYCMGHLGAAINFTEQALKITRSIFGEHHAR